MWNADYTAQTDEPAGIDMVEPGVALYNETVRHSAAHTMGQQVYSQAAKFGSKFLEESNRLMSKAPIIGEGPAPLRALCFLGGLGMMLTSGLYLFFILGLLTNPAIYILHCYEALFGIVIMIMEAKDFAAFNKAKAFMTEWLKFMTVPGGKGAFYFFTGSLGVSMVGYNIPLFIVGVYMLSLGVIAGLVHCGLRKELKRTGLITLEDDESIDASSNAGYSPGGQERRHPLYTPVHQSAI